MNRMFRCCLWTPWHLQRGRFPRALHTCPAAAKARFSDEGAVSSGEAICPRSQSQLRVAEQGQTQGSGAPPERPLPCVHREFFATPSFFILKGMNLNPKLGAHTCSCVFTFPPCPPPAYSPILSDPFRSLGMYLSVSRVAGPLVCDCGTPNFADVVQPHYILDMESHLCKGQGTQPMYSFNYFSKPFSICHQSFFL